MEVCKMYGILHHAVLFRRALMIVQLLGCGSGSRHCRTRRMIYINPPYLADANKARPLLSQIGNRKCCCYTITFAKTAHGVVF